MDARNIDKIVFQFHKGTSKKFHKGTSKTFFCYSYVFVVFRFNSIKVRVKPNPQ